MATTASGVITEVIDNMLDEIKSWRTLSGFDEFGNYNLQYTVEINLLNALKARVLQKLKIK